MRVAVVILNWNGKKWLEKFLPSVVDFNPSCSKIIVVDNASSDDSIDFLKQKYPQIEIIQHTSNEGFSNGYNKALLTIDAEYYVLLNSDVEVTANWMEPIIALMDRDKSIAACQPKIKAFGDKTKFEYAGAAGGFIDTYGYPFCRGRILNTIEEDCGQYDDEREIFWATGACLFVRAEYFHLVQGFDEDFFAHMEEIDLCWRLKNRGYKIMYSSASTVFHVGGGTLNKINPQKTYLNFRNNLQLILKNHSPNFLFFKLFFRLSLDGLAATKFLFSGQLNHSVAVLRAHKSFYFRLWKMLKKREELKTNITNYTTSAVYFNSIIADYYLRRKTTFKEIDPKKSL